MSNPTNPFSWQMPTSTDLVTDLPADFEVFGQAVATSMQYLLGGTTGQVLSKTSATDMAFTWVTDPGGDITGVTAGTGITGGGTSGTVTVTNDMATTITTNGDLIYGTGSGTYTRRAIGSASQVLTVAGGIPTWATPSTGGDLVKIGTTTTFTTSAAVNVDSCFSTTYDNYIIKLNINSSVSASNLNLRFRTGGTTSTASSYGNSWKYNAYGTAGASANLGSAVASNLIWMHDITSGATATNLDVNNPFTAFKTMITYNANQSNGYAVTGAGQFNATTSFDGFSFFPDAGTITGTVTVYGYTKG